MMRQSQVTHEYILEAIAGTDEPYEKAKERLQIEEWEEWGHADEQAALRTVQGAFEAWWKGCDSKIKARLSLDDARAVFVAGFKAGER